MQFSATKQEVSHTLVSLKNLCTIMVFFIRSMMVLKDLTLEHKHCLKDPGVLANMAKNREVF